MNAATFVKLADFGRITPHGAFEKFLELTVASIERNEEECHRLIETVGADFAQRSAELFGELSLEMSSKPWQDLLGPIHQELGARSSRQALGEFYTPHDVALVTAQLIVGQAPESRPVTILEPACGAGQMVLSAAEALVDQGVRQFDIRATCIDVSRVACLMCLVNLSLWAIPAVVIHGDTLEQKEWRRWYTPTASPWIRAAMMLAQLKGEPFQDGGHPTPDPSDFATDGQFTFRF